LKAKNPPITMPGSENAMDDVLLPVAAISRNASPPDTKDAIISIRSMVLVFVAANLVGRYGYGWMV